MTKRFTKITYFYGNCEDIYFDVYLSKKSYIQFCFKGKELITRDLVFDEVNSIVGLLRNIHFNLSSNGETQEVLMRPDIGSRLLIYKEGLKIDVTWKLSDVAKYPYFYESLESLSAFIQNLVSIDDLGIELPIFK